MNKDVKFLGDMKFYRKVSLILIDLFNYKPALSVDQFFEQGYGERKMIMVLDVYDIIKKCKREHKIKTQMAKQLDGPHPSDIA